MRFAASLLLVAACQRGTPEAGLSVARVREEGAKIVLCKTTEDELRAALGAPYRDGRIAAGRVLSWSPSGSDSAHYLAVLLRDRVVVDLYADVPSELPWTPTDRCRSQP